MGNIRQGWKFSLHHTDASSDDERLNQVFTKKLTLFKARLTGNLVKVLIGQQDITMHCLIRHLSECLALRVFEATTVQMFSL